MKLIIPGVQDTAERTNLIPLDVERLAALASRQIVIRPEHKGLAEFPIDPSRSDICIEGSVLAFNPEVQHDEAVGLKLVRVDAGKTRKGVALQQTKEGVTAALEEGEHLGMYLFTPSPNTATAQRFEDLCVDGGSIVKVQGTRKRSLVCAVRVGQEPLALGPEGELPVPLFAQEQGFPRAYLQTTKRQTLGVLTPGPRGYERRVNVESHDLVFGGNVPIDTDVTVAVMEYVEHADLRTAPFDLRDQLGSVLRGTVSLQPSANTRQPVNIQVLEKPQQRLVTGMRVRLTKLAKQAGDEAASE
jgi:hypothetical protein